MRVHARVLVRATNVSTPPQPRLVVMTIVGTMDHRPAVMVAGAGMVGMREEGMTGGVVARDKCAKVRE
jgi:hypothetical protein